MYVGTAFCTASVDHSYCPFMNGFPLNDGDFPYHTIPYHSYTKLPEGTSLLNIFLNYVAHHLSTLFARWYHFGSWRRDFRRVAAKLLGLRWFGDGPRSDGRYGPRLKIYTKICGPIGLETWQKTGTSKSRFDLFAFVQCFHFFPCPRNWSVDPMLLLCHFES